MWMSCPLQAKFAILDHLPRQTHARATYGTCIHAALEYYATNGNDVEGAIDVFVDVWANPEKLNAAPDFWPKYMTYGGYRERGIELLKAHHEKLRWEERIVIAAEHRFLVPFGEHELEGTVDLLESRKTGKGKQILRICDYKTTSRAPTIESLQNNVQYTVYIYASLQPEFWFGNGVDYPPMPNAETMYNTFFDLPRRGIQYQLIQNKELDAGSREESDFERIYRLIDELQKAIKYNVFVPNISGETCVFCSYVEQCGLTIKSKEEVEAEEESWI